MSADSPIRWPPGGTRSRSSPVKKPMIVPMSGPRVSPSATTTTSAMSGTLPPGSGNLSTTITCSSTTTSASTAHIAARLTSAPGALMTRCNHYSDHIKCGEICERAYQGGRGQPSAGLNPGDHADRNTGHIRHVTHRCGGDQLLAASKGAARAEDVQLQQVWAGAALRSARYPPHPAAARQPHASDRRRVSCQQDSAGPRAHADDRANEARRVEHGLLRLDAVAAANVQGHGLLISLADSYDVRVDDLVAASAAQPQQRGELCILSPAQLRTAQPRPEPDHLALQRLYPVARPGRAGDTTDKAGNRLCH